MAAQLTIGQLARIVGVNVQTGRYYECLNLLRPSARRPSRYRLSVLNTKKPQGFRFIEPGIALQLNR